MNTLASIFNLGGPDLIVILIICLLLFGAKKLPELARGMGQAVREFSKAKDDVERELQRAQEVPVQKPAEQLPHQTASTTAPTTPATSATTQSPS